MNKTMFNSVKNIIETFQFKICEHKRKKIYDDYNIINKELNIKDKELETFNYSDIGDNFSWPGTISIHYYDDKFKKYDLIILSFGKMTNYFCNISFLESRNKASNFCPIITPIKLNYLSQLDNSILIYEKRPDYNYINRIVIKENSDINKLLKYVKFFIDESEFLRELSLFIISPYEIYYKIPISYLYEVFYNKIDLYKNLESPSEKLRYDFIDSLLKIQCVSKNIINHPISVPPIKITINHEAINMTLGNLPGFTEYWNSIYLYKYIRNHPQFELILSIIDKFNLYKKLEPKFDGIFLRYS